MAVAPPPSPTFRRSHAIQGNNFRCFWVVSTWSQSGYIFRWTVIPFPDIRNVFEENINASAVKNFSAITKACGFLRKCDKVHGLWRNQVSYISSFWYASSYFEICLMLPCVNLFLMLFIYAVYKWAVFTITRVSIYVYLVQRSVDCLARYI